MIKIYKRKQLDELKEKILREADAIILLGDNYESNRDVDKV